MGRIRKPPPVKLVMGFIYRDKEVFFRVKDKLKKKFGQVDFESPALSFNYTDYYAKELGQDLTRSFVSFKKLIPAQQLYKVKRYTNRIERRFSRENKRCINIDPGYLDLAKLVLASTKDFSHRIYLHKGIFAEITLFFKDGSFRPWEWTYPDYRTPEYIGIFNRIRSLYLP